MQFAHEKLIAYQNAIQFVTWTHELVADLPVRLAVRDQLDRASTSIPLNIAEGNVKASERDRARFRQMAHGSTVECAACLDVLLAKGLKSREQVEIGKAKLHEICRLVLGLLRSSGSTVREDEEVYGEPRSGGGSDGT